ncbi:MAG TPA: acyltransferase, partial [Bradyrhizobium sp.]|nr:acyltransferase [Bradyrhizobium sp.]
RTGADFDEFIVTAICLAAIVVIMQATRVRRLPMPTSFVMAVGGLTYPLYLLHQQIGYVVFNLFSPTTQSKVSVAGIVLVLVLASWAIWRFGEQSWQRWTKHRLTAFAARFR